MSDRRAHEIALLAVGAAATGMLAVTCGPLAPATLGTAVGVTLYAVARQALSGGGERERKLRALATYGYVLWFYWQSTAVSQALGTRLRDRELLALDRWLLPETPAALSGRIASPALTDLMCACYQTYLVYLHVALIQALRGSAAGAERLARPLFTAFAAGLTLYLLVPALGPGAAFPDLCGAPLEGGLMTRVNAAVIERGSSVLGTFPSLHVLITLVLLAHDRRYAPARFRVFALPAVGLIASTVYLRYHYAIDLLAGFAVFAALDVAGREARKPEVAGA